jgi:acylphosphatase
VAEPVGRKVRVFGRVQGVFYRQWTLKQARALGVTGWVHNANDGSVEAHLSGDNESVLAVIEQMRRGPPQARVDDLTVQEIEPEDFPGFSVRL